MTDRISTTWQSDDIAVRASGKRLQGYHHLEIEADNSYEIDLWKDGALSRGRRGHRLKENTNPGIDLAISTDADLADERYRISPGRSSETSHYADLRELEDDTLTAAADAVQEYMAAAGDTAVDAVDEFFADARQDRI